MANVKHSSDKHNFTFVKPLYLLANFLAISPPYRTDIQYKNENNTTMFKIWSSFIGILIISTYAYCMEGASREIFSQVKMTTTVIEIILFTSITVSNIISVFGAGFSNATAWKNMLNTLNDVNHKLQISEIKKKRLTIFYSLIIFGHVFFAGILTYDFYVGQEIHGLAIYHYHFILRAQYYFIFVTVILICFFATSIRNRYINRFNITIVRKIL